MGGLPYISSPVRDVEDIKNKDFFEGDAYDEASEGAQAQPVRPLILDLLHLTQTAR